MNSRPRLFLMYPLLLLTGNPSFGEEGVPFDEGIPFDVENGKTWTLYETELAFDIRVDCEFEVEQVYHGPRWNPVVIISMYSKEKENDVGRDHVVKLSASQDEDDAVWHFGLEVFENQERVTDLVVNRDTTETTLPLELNWYEAGYIKFRAGKDAEVRSRLDTSDLGLVGWEVSVSGVKGTAKCSVYKIAGRSLDQSE